MMSQVGQRTLRSVSFIKVEAHDLRKKVEEYEFDENA